MKITLSLFTFFFSSFGWAGIELHGGNVLVCEGKEPVLLEYYEATLGTIGGSSSAVEIPNSSVADALDFLIGRFSSEGHGYQLQLRQALTVVGNVDRWISSDLKTTDDLDLPYTIPAGCEVKTAAVRTKNQIMYGNPQIISRLSNDQLALLILHEAVYLVSNADSALPTRDVLRWVLNEQTPDAKTVEGILASASAIANPIHVLFCANCKLRELTFLNDEGKSLQLFSTQMSPMLRVRLPEEKMSGEISCKKTATVCRLSFSAMGGPSVKGYLRVTDGGKALEVEALFGDKRTIYRADLF